MSDESAPTPDPTPDPGPESQPDLGQDDSPAPIGADAAAAKPWYKKPLPLILLGILLLAVVGAIVYLVFGGDDDPRLVNSVTIERVDDEGQPVETELAAQVVGQAGDENSFLWVQPALGGGRDSATNQTGPSNGIVSFMWEPSSAVELPLEWESTITMLEQLPAGTGLSGATFECSLGRADGSSSTVTLAIDLQLPADETEPTIAVYTFPNRTFLTGDIVRCDVANGVSPTTTTTTSTTTVPATTTTTTTTTVPATTTTIPATTTTAPAATTPPATTTPTETTEPPVVTSLMDVIDGRSDLSELAALIDVAGLREALSAPDATITLFAPDNDAITALAADPDAPDLTDPVVVSDLLLAHANTTQVLDAATVLASETVVVMVGSPQPVDATVDRPTIGGAGIIEPDVAADNGVIHVLDAVMPIQP